MTRVNLVLLALLIVSALGTVAAQHKSRRLFADLEHEQSAQRRLDIEYRQLQLEQSTWAMHARIEKVALAQLKMQMPTPARVQVVERDPASAAVPATGAAMSGPASPSGPRAPDAAVQRGAVPAVPVKPAGAAQ